MLILVVIDVIDHGRQCGGLTRTGGPGDQYQTARHGAYVLKDVAHSQLFHRQYFGGNRSKHRPRTAVLVKGVDPEACHAWHFKRKVSLQKLFKILALDRKSTRLNSSHVAISYAVCC